MTLNTNVLQGFHQSNDSRSTHVVQITTHVKVLGHTSIHAVHISW